MNEPDEQRGFTLIELMIVVAVIAIVASITVPNLLSARVTANEAAAIATLKNLASAETQCRSSGQIDVNQNGAGEYAFFGELSGAVGVRTDETGGVGTEQIRPSFVTAKFQNVQGGRVLLAGYVFQLYLPDAAGAPVAEAAAGGGAGVAVSGALAERLWACYAWPASRGNSGQRAFFVNESGAVLACRNATAAYSGSTATPAGTAAALASVASPSMASSVAVNATGQDGELWYSVN